MAAAQAAAAAEQLSVPTLVVKNKGMLTVAIMLATVMQVLDTTIANVALPHMAASLNAAQDEINWILTSYIVAAAIATPLTGWVSDRLGRKNVMILAIIGFTVASLLCGVATSLPQMVVFRVLQGICGAVIAPLAQSIMLDINPREKIGQAMAIYGAGIMVGPIIGPTLVGWLTESFNWRAVFLVNLPVGIIAVVAMVLFMPKSSSKERRFDFFGFAMLGIAVGALQLLLDRGQQVDWFSAMETWIYVGLAISGIWVFIVHCATAANPFIDLAMFKDRNFSMGLIFIFIVGITLFSGLALLPPLLQNLMGYPVIDTGLMMAPRGLGTMASMIIVGRLVSRVDPRMLVLSGTLLMAGSLYWMTGFDISMGTGPIIWSGVLQGFGMGFVFVPLSTLTFVSTRPEHRLDATAMFSLVRNVGSGVGISVVTTVLAQMNQVNHAELAERITLNSQPVRDFLSVPATPGLMQSMLNSLVSQQAAMLAYLDDFQLMLWITLASIPIIFLLRRPKTQVKMDPTHISE